VILTDSDMALDAIERKRNIAGISQRELAKRAGLSKNAYWHISHQGSDLHVKSLIGLAEAVGLKLTLTDADQ
jgi:transcriptional regulator with XRE-family HTH domain